MTAARWQVCETTGEVVCDEHERQAEAVRQPRQQLEDLRLHHHVERRRRLVGEQDRRVAGERHRDRCALAHAAGELVREVAGARCRDADELEQLADVALGLFRVRRAVELDRLHDLVTDPLDGVERVHRALEDHRDVAPAVLGHGLLAALEDVLAAKDDPAGDAGRRRQQPHDREDRRRLAAAGLADEPEPLAVTELEAHALDGMELAAALELEPDVEVLDLEDRLRHSESSLSSSGLTRKR